MNFNVSEIILFDGTENVKINEIGRVFRAAVKDGKGLTDEYSGPWGPLGIEIGLYVLGTSGENLVIGKKFDEDDEENEGKYTYVELTGEEFTDYLD